jgi:hypothetical protein
VRTGDHHHRDHALDREFPGFACDNPESERAEADKEREIGEPARGAVGDVLRARAARLGLSRATYRKMVQNLIWATGYNAIAIPMAAGITFGTGFLMTPAVGAVFMSASTIIVAINAQFLRLYGRKK